MNNPEFWRNGRAEPSETGRRKYPPSGYYNHGLSPEPYTCKPECKYDCKGECGCEACHRKYQDWLSVE